MSDVLFEVNTDLKTKKKPTIEAFYKNRPVTARIPHQEQHAPVLKNLKSRENRIHAASH